LTGEEQVRDRIVILDENELKLHREALAEGFKDWVCSECKIVALAHKHFLNCVSQTCPMAMDGKPKTLF
jgi:hypothetical protein